MAMNCVAKLRFLLRFPRIRSQIIFSHVRHFRTASNSPSQLTLDDIGSLYSVPKEDSDALTFDKLLPPLYSRQVNTFEECVWMCRKPFLEIKSYLQAARTSLPSIRIVLWGKFGTGKTIALCQAVHHAHREGWIVFVVKDAMDLTRKASEIQMSSYREGRIDCSSHAVALLEVFKKNNAKSWRLLTEMKTSKEYEWSKLEKTAAGRPLTDVVEMGLSAPFTACDCVGVLLKELKSQSSSGAMRLFVAIDGANSLYGKTTVKRADRSFASPNDLTLVRHLRKLFTNDWTNGACLLVADKREVSDARDRQTVPLSTPLELFGEEGFEGIDPFIPVETSTYSAEEINNLYDYYKEKMWITSKLGRTERGRKELEHLSAFNPYFFERLCAFN